MPFRPGYSLSSRSEKTAMPVPVQIKTFLLILVTLLNPCVIKKNLLEIGQIEYQQNQFKHNSNSLTCTVAPANKLVSAPVQQAKHKYILPAIYQQVFTFSVSQQQYRLKQTREIVCRDKLYLTYHQLKIPSSVQIVHFYSIT